MMANTPRLMEIRMGSRPNKIPRANPFCPRGLDLEVGTEVILRNEESGFSIEWP